MLLQEWKTLVPDEILAVALPSLRAVVAVTRSMVGRTGWRSMSLRCRVRCSQKHCQFRHMTCSPLRLGPQGHEMLDARRTAYPVHRHIQLATF